MDVTIAWGWQRESTAFYAGQGDIAITQRVEVFIKAIEVVSLATLIKGEKGPIVVDVLSVIGFREHLIGTKAVYFTISVLMSMLNFCE